MAVLGGDDACVISVVARLFKARRFSEGQTVIQEGSGGAAFFVIESGEAGEIALLDQGTRAATITASSELVCYGSGWRRCCGRPEKARNAPISPS